MLLRLITVISLFTFMLLLISDAQIDNALYKSLLVFLLLFTGVYLSIFFLNILQNNSKSDEYAVAKETNTHYKDEK